MLKSGLKASCFLFLIFVFFTCIDPYNPKLSGYESLLVVEGLITDEKAPYEVRLSRSIQHEDSVPKRITDADVFITDETGKTEHLENCGDGSYKTDSAEFTGVIGKTYILHITTIDGAEYKSDPVVMLPVPGIDKIYYEKDEEYADNQSETHEGIRIFVDTGDGSEDSQYIRWEYEETWKFRLPDYKRFNYIGQSLIVPLEEVEEFCWKTLKSSVILNSSILPGQTNYIKKLPICFIGSDKSNRLTIRYSILVKQYSLSKEAFEFWNNLKQVNETGGSIFDTQPYPVISNINNVNNPGEKVLGYFQVSAVKQKRTYITRSELDELDLPWFKYDCKRFVVSPDDYPPAPMRPPMTWDELYDMFMSRKDFTFVEPIYNNTTHQLEKLVFVQNYCSDCKLTGFSEKPGFWIDLN
ncbi:MAG: DUF4249 domain-containing protein [Bacteroidales bacterium]|nr:DUF4249 domain-containing protein [Bacteroidales bacterium]